MDEKILPVRERERETEYVVYYPTTTAADIKLSSLFINCHSLVIQEAFVDERRADDRGNRDDALLGVHSRVYSSGAFVWSTERERESDGRLTVAMATARRSLITSN